MTNESTREGMDELIRELNWIAGNDEIVFNAECAQRAKVAIMELTAENTALKANCVALIESLMGVEGCNGCEYAIDDESCSCETCDDADDVTCNETCPWWGDPCGDCQEKDGWTWRGAQEAGEGKP